MFLPWTGRTGTRTARSRTSDHGVHGLPVARGNAPRTRACSKLARARCSLALASSPALAQRAHPRCDPDSRPRSLPLRRRTCRWATSRSRCASPPCTHALPLPCGTPGPPPSCSARHPPTRGTPPMQRPHARNTARAAGTAHTRGPVGTASAAAVQCAPRGATDAACGARTLLTTHPACSLLRRRCVCGRASDRLTWQTPFAYSTMHHNICHIH